jgi:RNA polymerase sigma-70 factor, ECF subfamily
MKTTQHSDVCDASLRGDLEPQLEAYRTELRGYCYRMLGSPFEADDAVQETMVRAWKALDRFEGRSSLRSWLYRIATNVCFDQLDGRKRRALPMDLEGPGSPEGHLAPPLIESTWVQPIPDDRVLPDDGDPAELATSRESIRLAFVAALQRLPARQRAVLILREVLRWHADEVAQLLDTTVASVNSALQRARATLAASDLSEDQSYEPDDDAQRELLQRYVEAFERYDVEALVALIHEDATFDMPPFPMWLRGTTDIAAWYRGPGIECSGSRLVPLGRVNGMPAFAQYRTTGPWCVQVLELSGDRIVGLHHFLDVDELFPYMGAAKSLDD